MQNWVTIGKAKHQNKGGVKWVSRPPCQEGMTMHLFTSLTQNTLNPPEEGPSLPVEGWLHTLH